VTTLTRQIEACAREAARWRLLEGALPVRLLGTETTEDGALARVWVPDPTRAMGGYTVTVPLAALTPCPDAGNAEAEETP
jgi:hypothetical protein